jgi:hypothetical protein
MYFMAILEYFMAILEYFMNIWDILCPFGTLCVHLVHFSGFGVMHQEKSGNPGRKCSTVNSNGGNTR